MGSVLVPHEPASAAIVRNVIGADLAGRVSERAIDDVLLIASELVGNAIRHTPSTDRRLSIEWDLDRSYATVRVSDSGADAPHPRSAALNEPTGRGLTIVQAVSDDWGFQRFGDGKYVWARIPLSPSTFAGAH